MRYHSSLQISMQSVWKWWIIHVKVKVKVRTLDIAPLRESSPQKRSCMARVLKESHSFISTPTRSSAIKMRHTCLCLPSYSWYSFTDPKGWKAELAWVAGFVVRQFTCLKAVTHPTTNRAQCAQLHWWRPTHHRYTKPVNRHPYWYVLWCIDLCTNLACGGIYVLGGCVVLICWITVNFA